MAKEPIAALFHTTVIHMNVGDREGPSENLTKSYTLSLVMQLAKRQLFQAHIYNDQWCAPNWVSLVYKGQHSHHSATSS